MVKGCPPSRASLNFVLRERCRRKTVPVLPKTHGCHGNQSLCSQERQCRLGKRRRARDEKSIYAALGVGVEGFEGEGVNCGAEGGPVEGAEAGESVWIFCHC